MGLFELFLIEKTTELATYYGLYRSKKLSEARDALGCLPKVERRPLLDKLTSYAAGKPTHAQKQAAQRKINFARRVVGLKSFENIMVGLEVPDSLVWRAKNQLKDRLPFLKRFKAPAGMLATRMLGR